MPLVFGIELFNVVEVVWILSNKGSFLEYGKFVRETVGFAESCYICKKLLLGDARERIDDSRPQLVSSNAME